MSGNARTLRTGQHEAEIETPAGVAHVIIGRAGKLREYSFRPHPSDEPEPPSEPIIEPPPPYGCEVSLITTCKDRLHHLRETLPTMLEQGAGEIIVVCYGDEEAAEWVDQAATVQRHVRPLRVDPGDGLFRKPHALNVAAREARGRVLAFCDADRPPREGWLQTALEALEADGVIAAHPERMPGIIAIRAADYHRLRGHDERMWGAAYEDVDFLNRAAELGRVVTYRDGLLREIQHTREAQTRYTPTDSYWELVEHNELVAERREGPVNPHGYGYARPQIEPPEPNMANEITPQIVIGNQADGRNRELLDRMGCKAVVSFTHEQFPTDDPRLTFHVPFEDGDQACPLAIQAAVLALASSIQRNGRVLVHCAAGLSRAPMVVSLYLHLVDGMDFQDAVELVKMKRPKMCEGCDFDTSREGWPLRRLMATVDLEPLRRVLNG